MSMSTKKNIAIVLLVLSMLLWVLRKINILYIPGLSMLLLALSMVLVGVMMFQLKEKKKLAGTMIVAFGLFCRKCYLAKTFSGEFIILDGAFALFCLLSL